MSSRFSSLARQSAVLGLCACLFANGGCSYMFVDGPPKQHAQLPYFTCTTSKGWPVVDTVLGSIYGLESVVMLAASSERDSESGLLGAGLAAGGLAALFIASAVSGYHDASECREATENLQLRLMRMYPGPGLAPTPYTPAPVNDPWVRPLNRPFAAPASRPESPTEELRAPSTPTPPSER